MSMTGDAQSRTGLTGRRALVTGAARGIGRSIAERIARSGAAVTLADLDAETLSATVGELLSQGLEVFGTVADVTVERDVERMVSATAAQWACDELRRQHDCITMPPDWLCDGGAAALSLHRSAGPQVGQRW